ncbi:DUF4124 domain-containing protein [Marinobacter mobilis]|uniref:SmpA / OmlA family protein n=1 Tax=Marinobacter mobilis TaxID=488533 RepID=A0A1H2PZW8_9GAMM|nr:DUF4124 domain-containing protein [Marinobacter mobilis]SDW00044.1 SmpA / OmlA family protein [Marinobacter mobilis]
MRYQLLLWLLLLASVTQAEVYRCEGPNGTTFTDRPCSGEGSRIEVQDNRIGGQFDQNLPPEQPSPMPDSGAEATPVPESPCRFINSTDLRTYLIRGQVVVGMTREQVREAFGPPPETYPVPQETWIYQTDYYGKLYELTYVYFREGCVESVVYRKP